MGDRAVPAWGPLTVEAYRLRLALWRRVPHALPVGEGRDWRRWQRACARFYRRRRKGV